MDSLISPGERECHGHPQGAFRSPAAHSIDADGSWNSEIRYTAFGEIRSSSGLTPTQYRFTGQLAQAEVGVAYYVARFYDPALAHFVQADTLVPQPGDPRAFDRYSYVLGNPINFNDPTGHWVETVLDFAFIGYDVYQISQEGWTPVNTVALAADIACAVLPVATGGGAAVRVAVAGSETAAKVAAHVPEAVRAAQGAEKLLQFAENSTTPGSIESGYKQPALPSMKDYLPSSGQDHHFLTNKNDYWTPIFKEITDKYKLDLNENWNIRNVVVIWVGILISIPNGSMRG
jgi:RHS repeat-associated protein